MLKKKHKRQRLWSDFRKQWDEDRVASKVTARLWKFRQMHEFWYTLFKVIKVQNWVCDVWLPESSKWRTKVTLKFKIISKNEHASDNYEMYKKKVWCLIYFLLLMWLNTFSTSQRHISSLQCLLLKRIEFTQKIATTFLIAIWALFVHERVCSEFTLKILK